jgi:protein-tyrosine phosphatase
MMDTGQAAAAAAAAASWQTSSPSPSPCPPNPTPPATRLSQSTNASPDPYYDYGGSKGFELVLDLLDDACEGLLQTIQNARQ